MMLLFINNSISEIYLCFLRLISASATCIVVSLNYRILDSKSAPGPCSNNRLDYEHFRKLQFENHHELLYYKIFDFRQNACSSFRSKINYTFHRLLLSKRIAHVP